MLSHKWFNLTVICTAQLLGMTLWFSASAVVPQLTASWSLSPAAQSWMTMSVQIGFVVGALVSAIVNLPDRVPVRALIAAAMLAGAGANALLVLLDGQTSVAVGLRFLTGAALACVYPPGMKLIVTWCRRDRGLGIGLLIAALTVGSAIPHLLNALPGDGAGGMPPWRGMVLASSGLAVAGAVAMRWLVRPGPYAGAPAPFEWSFVLRALAHRPTRLANYGYLGHMWELYAMWTWVPVLLIASYEAAGRSVVAARLAGFATIAAGGVGSVLAGILADRWGRTRVAGASLVVSGGCCLLVGACFGTPTVLTAVCLVWGFAVVADSAQFSAAVSELTDRRYVGTALTLQTSLGFLLTLLTIRLVPVLREGVGWEWVFVGLAAGPVFGAVSMARLRRLPEAAGMAGGRR